MLPTYTRIALGTLISLAIFSCGRARPNADPNWLQVNGKAQFGNQCPDGSWVDPMPAQLLAMDCNLPLPKVSLTQALEPLVISADCTKKVITVRSPTPGSLDLTWEVLPDNTFDFNIDGGKIELVDDGRGHKGCLLPAVVNIFGVLNCKDRDRITIDFQASWRAGKLDPANYSIIPFTKLREPGETFCQVAPTCYLTAGTKLNQCM